MPPKTRATPAKGRGGYAHNPHAVAAPVEKLESLLATDEEKQATSASLYGDHKARISANGHHAHDVERQQAYGTAVTNLLRGKTVLHIGCGMGLLSMVAARAQAKAVVAVDASAIVDAAAVVARQNGLENVTFVRGSLRDGTAALPAPFAADGSGAKFDVVLCEWMGVFVNNETAALRETLFAMQHLMADGAEVVPNAARLKVGALADYEYKSQVVDFWDNVYGFAMKPMQPLVRQEPTASSLPAHLIKTDIVEVACVTIGELYAQAAAAAAAAGKKGAYEAPEAALAVGGSFELAAQRKATLDFLTFYCDGVFTAGKSGAPGAAAGGSASAGANAAANFVLASRPGAHNPWTEVSAMLPEPLPVFCGDTISGRVDVTPQGDNVAIAIRVKCQNSLVDHESSCTQHFQY